MKEQVFGKTLLLLLFVFSSSLYGQYDKVVVLGASIMEQVYGQDLNTPNATRTAEWKANGVDVDVYGYGFGGEVITSTVSRLETALNTYTSNTLFMVHIGGNNVTNTRPYDTATATQLQDISDDYDALIAVIPPMRKEDVIIMPITFRTYDISEDIYNNESLGSLPYNQDILIPKILANTPSQINIDGNPIVDLYNFTRTNYETYFDINAVDFDGVHPSILGEDLLSDFMSDRASYWVNGGAVPDPLTSNIAVTGVTLSSNAESLITGNSVSLSATISPNNATNQSVTWSSDNLSVATVVDGLVSTNSSGFATITVTTDGGGYTDTALISVYDDTDGDGTSDNLEASPTEALDPCLPVQSVGYTGYDGANAIWMSADCDGDGVNNGEEATNGTDPYQVSGDTDGDGIDDDNEINNGTGTTNSCDPVQSAGYTGYDGANAIWMSADCDGDGVNNGEEATNGTDPYDSNPQDDMDLDGISDGDDNCPATYNPGQEDFDSDGIGDVCDDDVDNDGVSNEEDICEKTPPGVFIDEDGCTIMLDSDNFLVSITGESCLDKQDGKIEVSAKVTMNYRAVLVDGNGSEIDSIEFTQNTDFSNLPIGNYSLCVSVGNSIYEQCYTLQISGPEPLSVDVNTVTSENQIELELSGSDLYKIELNGEVYVTDESEITLYLKEIRNSLKISTDLTCQGIYEKVIMLSSNGFIYPNPVEDMDLNVFVGVVGLEKVQLNIFDINGVKVMDTSLETDGNGYVKTNVSQLSQGIYFLTVITINSLTHYKIIKK